MSEEAQQVCQFLIPDIDEALELFNHREEPTKIRAILSEPLATINDLITDFGGENEALL